MTALTRLTTVLTTPTTRPTTKSKGKVPGEEGSKRPTPKPAAKPKGKVPGEGEADTKGSANPRTSARKAAASKGKAPKLTKAAQQLQWSRMTLYRKMEKYGIANQSKENSAGATFMKD